MNPKDKPKTEHRLVCPNNIDHVEFYIGVVEYGTDFVDQSGDWQDCGDCYNRERVGSYYCNECGMDAGVEAEWKDIPLVKPALKMKDFA